MKTSLIIPCYFADYSFVEMTQRCLESLEYGRPDNVWVVNDGSPYKVHYTYFNAKFKVRVALQANGGYASAVNKGLELSNREGYDVFIIANNDIEFTPGWLDAILKPLQNGYDISTIRNTEADGYEVINKITDGDKFGALWAITRKAYNILGPLDERFGKGYFDDTDYRRRALEAGLRIGKNHAAVVEHIGKATFSYIDPEDKLYEENKSKYIEKWGELD